MIIGAIFPIPSETVKSLFSKKTSIFVKYTIFKKLEKDSKILFYISKEKLLLGEGTIEKIDTATPDVAWARYGKDMFLNAHQFNQYTTKSPIDKKRRKMKKVTVFVLIDLVKFKKPLQWKHKFTPSGCYITKTEYQKIRAQNY